MGHRVIGVEVEGGVLRAAVVETRLRRFELKTVVSVPLDSNPDEPAWLSRDRTPAEGGDEPTAIIAAVPGPAGPGMARIADLLRVALGEPLAPTDSFAFAFPGVHAFVRRLALPFKDGSRIAATLPFQMIGQIPVQPDEIHCAFEALGTEAGRTEVLAVAVPKGAFREWLSGVRSSGVEPAHVGVDGVCLASLLPYLGPRDGGAPVMLIRTGEDQAEFVVARGNRVEMVRVVALGEPVLRDGEVSPALMREVLVTAAGASEAGVSVGSVLVTGADGEALRGPLGEVLGVPCEVLDPARLGLPGGDECPGLHPAAARVVALALGAASGGGPGSLNLLAGEFQREGAYSLFRERFRLFAVALVVFAILGAGRFAGRVVGMHAEHRATLAEIRSLSAQVLGEERDDHAAVLKSLKSASEEDVQVFPRWTAVDALGRLVAAVMAMGPSSAGGGALAAEDSGTEGEARKPAAGLGGHIAPEDTAAVEIETIRVEPRSLNVRGEADTIETLDGLVERLKSDPCFHEVTTESTERIQFRRHQGWQRFSLRMEVDCGEGRKVVQGTSLPAQSPSSAAGPGKGREAAGAGGPGRPIPSSGRLPGGGDPVRTGGGRP